VSRVTPDAQGAAMYHLGRARQTETWPALQEEQIPTLLLLATEPPAAFEQNQRAAHAFKAVIHQADVQLLEGATHSLVSDLRIAFGQLVLEFLHRQR
jgi:pimeloyl-ACP methyl ester carboxylesterase